MMNQEEKQQWYQQLQTTIIDALKKHYEADAWKYSQFSDRSLSSDIIEIEGAFTIEKFDFNEVLQELHIYAQLGENYRDLPDIQALIYRVFARSAEDFFILLPLHTAEALQFWFLTGFPSHCHRGRIIIPFKTNPHLSLSD